MRSYLKINRLGRSLLRISLSVGFEESKKKSQTERNMMSFIKFKLFDRCCCPAIDDNLYSV